MKKVGLPEELIKPVHDISVVVIGAGGTGSEVLRHLARMSMVMYLKMGKGFNVTLVDPDIITEANLARQSFSQSDLGRFKSDILIERVNRFYGYNWRSVPKKFESSMVENGVGDNTTNIYISCTDNVSSRKKIHAHLTKVSNLKNPNYFYNDKAIFWFDLGNDFNTGNIFIEALCQGSIKKDTGFANFIKAYGPDVEDNPDTPSCSMMEALSKQHLFINSFIASTAMNILYDALWSGEIDCCGAFVNLPRMSIKKIPIGYYDKGILDKSGSDTPDKEVPADKRRSGTKKKTLQELLE